MREFPYVVFLSPPSLPGLTRQSIASQDFLEDGWIRGSSPRMTTLVGERTLPLDLRLQRILDHAIEGRRLWRSLVVALLGDECVPAAGTTRGGLCETNARICRRDPRD